MIEEQVNTHLEWLRRLVTILEMKTDWQRFHTTIMRLLIPPSVIRCAISLMLPVTLAKTSSSRSKGMTSAAEKGQPIVAPIPNHMSPLWVFNPSSVSMKAAIPIIVVHIAKLEGK